MPTRRQFIGATAAAAAIASLSPARAQGRVDGWPARAVRVISPTATGGPGQNFRMYADVFKDTFGQNFVLENMPGGSGSVGCMAVARSAPDGHTLLVASNSNIVLAPIVLTNSPVNVKRDFAPIALMFTFPFLLVVNAELGPKTLKDLIDYAKARPGQLNWGSPGVGTGGHLVTELLLKSTGIQGQHVPYPGTTQQLQAAAAGTLQFTFDTPGNSRGLRDAGKVIGLAVTGRTRTASEPDMPTFRELGYEGFDDLRVAIGLLAPAGTPRPIVEAINREIVKMNSSGPIRDRLVQATYEPGTGTPEDYAAMIDRELAQWGAIVRDTGVQIKS
jgi:tripartite-type tricarboxylate transporter receptor subunit TctC